MSDEGTNCSFGGSPAPAPPLPGSPPQGLQVVFVRLIKVWLPVHA